MQLDIFRDEKIYVRLDAIGDPLARLNAVMDWTPYVRIVEAERPDKTQTGKGGRPPIQAVAVRAG